MNYLFINFQDRTKVKKKIIDIMSVFVYKNINPSLLFNCEIAVYTELQKMFKDFKISVNSLQITEESKKNVMFDKYKSFIIIKVIFELNAISLKNSFVFFLNNITGEIKYKWFSEEPELKDIKKMMEVKDED